MLAALNAADSVLGLAKKKYSSILWSQSVDSGCHSYAMCGKTWSPVSEWDVSTESYIDLSILVFLHSGIGKIVFKGSI